MASRNPSTQWLPLSAACALLKVHQSTLRQWADNGQVRTFRTAGGHRRFLLDDLTAMQRGNGATHVSTASLEEKTLTRIRRKLHGEHPPQSQAWIEKLPPEGRLKMRLFGRRLVDLSIAYLSQKRKRVEALTEVGLLAEEYGQDLARISMPLDQVLEVFIFFRNSLFDAVRDGAQQGSLRGQDIGTIWQQMEQLSDHMLLSMIRAYERSQHGAVNRIETAAQTGSEL